MSFFGRAETLDKARKALPTLREEKKEEEEIQEYKRLKRKHNPNVVDRIVGGKKPKIKKSSNKKKVKVSAFGKSGGVFG
jgi:hypothetical protein